MKLRTVWPEDVSRVRKFLGMAEDRLDQDVAALKSWLRKQPHLSPLIGGECFVVRVFKTYYYLIYFDRLAQFSKFFLFC